MKTIDLKCERTIPAQPENYRGEDGHPREATTK